MVGRTALCGALLLAAATATPAAALTFNFTTINGDTLTAGQATAFQTAANVWSSYLTDSVTVNVQIGFASLAAGVLGETSPSFVQTNGAAVLAALTTDAKDADDRQAVASLATDSLASSRTGQIALTSAEARAIGLTTGATTDGTIQFSSNFTFSNSRDGNGNVAAGTYDLVGIAEHEIGHLLGFDSSIDYNGALPQTLLDQFRYSAASTRSVTAGASAYFSIDNGATDIANFSVGGSNNSQASHWLQGTNGVMVPEVGAGQTQNITPLDVRALDVIGYDVAVPEPASLILLGAGLLGVALARRRR